MYFILSKVLLFLLYPILWFFALFIIAITIKNARRKKRLLIASALLLYLFSNSILLNLFAKAWDYSPYPVKDTKTYSCAIVLGGFSGVDGSGNGFFNAASDRFIEGIELLATGKAKHLLISSGNGNLIPGKFKEADWVGIQLKNLHFTDSSILIENNSRNTIENAVFSKKILLARHLNPPYLLVTSAFHMRRSMMIFKKEGYNVIPYPCNYIAGQGDITLGDLLPSAEALSTWNMYLKELVGYVVDYLKI